jgi:hypothetical protein
MPEIKERPILFSAPMVRAILEDRKMVTRREVKKPAALDCLAAGFEPAFLALPGNAALCPYGKPGDRLWVRETFALLGNEDGACIEWGDQIMKGNERGAARIYRASCTVGDYGLWEIPRKADWKPDTEEMFYEGAWRPSIHMPRWACRILLEITDVRVERLQDITYEEAVAEGVHRDNCCRMWTASDEGGTCHKYPVPAFKDLWTGINGPDAWDANPWVWVVEFKRVIP